MTTRYEGPYQLGTIQKIAVAATSAASSAAFSVDTRVLRLACNTDCYYLFGASPTASATTSHLLPAFSVEYILCPAATKIAVIRDTADGDFTVTECSR